MKTHKMNFKAVFILFLFLTFFGGLGVSSVYAQGAGIEIKPAIIEERVEPGQEYNSNIRVKNLGSSTDTFYLSKQDITGIAEDGRPIFTDNTVEKTDLEASTWISFGKESVTLAPKEEGIIPITIRVPAGTVQRGYFASILITTNPPELKGVGTAVAYGASTIVALRVGGNAGQAIEEASIREFRTDKTIYGKAEVGFITKVANIGNVLVRPRGPLEITDMFGKKVASLVVNPDGGAILPNGERKFETSWKGEGLLFGRYQVVMSLVYGEEDKKTISETLSFWILPTKIIVPILAGIIALILVLVIFSKLYVKRKLQGMGLTSKSDMHLSDRRKDISIPRPLLITAIVLACTLIFFLAFFIFFA